MIDRCGVRRRWSEVDDAEDRAVGGWRHTNLRLRAVGRRGHVHGKLARYPQQRHAVAAGAALLGLEWAVEQRDRFALRIMAGHDPARRSKLHRLFLQCDWADSSVALRGLIGTSQRTKRICSHLPSTKPRRP